MSESSTAARIIDGLLANAEPVEAGSFTIDRSAAVEKLRTFQYGDRHRYLIPVMEGLFVLGATTVSVETMGEDLSIFAEGIPLADPARSLAGLGVLGAAPTVVEARGLERIGVGLDMCLGIEGVARIVVTHVDGDVALAAEFLSGEPPTITELSEYPPWGLRVLVDRRWQERMILSGAASKELRHLEDAVQLSPRLVTIDATTASRRERNLDYSQELSGPGFRLRGGMRRHGTQPSRVELWSSDLQIGSRMGRGQQFVAAVTFDAPRYDLSQMKLVEDEVLEAALHAVERARQAAMRDLAEDDGRWTLETRPGPWSRERVASALGRDWTPISVPIEGGTSSVSAVFVLALAVFVMGVVFMILL